MANEVSLDFVQRWRSALKAKNPEVYLVGEVWDLRPQFLQGDQFDSLMNYTLGRGGSPPAFGGALGFARGGPLQNGRRVLGELARVYATYPEAVAAMGFNLIGSHDTPRVLPTLAGAGCAIPPRQKRWPGSSWPLLFCMLCRGLQCFFRARSVVLLVSAVNGPSTNSTATPSSGINAGAMYFGTTSCWAGCAASWQSASFFTALSLRQCYLLLECGRRRGLKKADQLVLVAKPTLFVRSVLHIPQEKYLSLLD